MSRYPDIKSICKPHWDGDYAYYHTKVIPYHPYVGHHLSLGNLIEDAEKANMSMRQYLWEILKQWNNPTDSRINHWISVLMTLKPNYYSHCIIHYYGDKQKAAAETVLRCLKYMEEQEIYGIVTETRAYV
ncbi:MAG: hypothetical protein QQW96_03840 [Tychonema bourrellyi B0820]|nr:hypothetical protein [Tychonema bourrellyi B0820]PJE45231.1 MAG: hypothetical protein CUR32_01115 [Flavobacterium sp.] [Flavobacterium sp. FEMGT703F]